MRVHEEKFQKHLDEESSSLESEMRSDVEARIKVLEEASERNSLSELERRFRSERETMEAALALRRQEMALEMEVEMEQRVAEAAKKRESEMMANLEDKLSKKEDLSKKEIKEILNGIESEIRVKWEEILMEARQNTLERSN